MVKAISQMIG